MDTGELLDVIRLALFECRIEHDDVEWMAGKILRRVEEYLNGCDDEKVGGTD